MKRLLLTSICSAAVLYTLDSTAKTQPTDHSVQLRFCYEDKQLLPYYAGDGESVASPPGVTIEHLQASVASISELTLQLQRKPWLRCLQLLEQNKVDALVATYSTERLSYAEFPLDNQQKPDISRAMSSHTTCVIQRPGSAVMARREEPLVIARPLGYATPDYPDNVTIVSVQSQQQAFELVVQQRVDATTTLCEVNGIKAPADMTPGLEIVYPPLYQITGYLVFSKGFYQQHKKLAEQLWRALATHRDESRYFEYLLLPQAPVAHP